MGVLSGKREGRNGALGMFRCAIAYVSSLERAEMEPRKGRDGGAKHGFSWCGMGCVGYRTGSLYGKWLNVRMLQKCARIAYLGARRCSTEKTV